jgi:hypothetical protein
MIVYPNQKIVTVHKAVVDEKNIYMRLNKKAMIEACKNLSGLELNAFLYLSSNQDKYELALSTEDMSQQMGGSVRSYQNAIRTLIKKGYLVKNHKNRYDFYDFPDQSKTAAVNTQEVAVQPEENCTINNVKTALYQEEKCVEIKKDIKKKTKENNNKDLFDANSEEWKNITKRIKVEFLPTSIKKLSEAAGTEVQPKVINRIISYNANAFDNHMDKPEGYRFNTLFNLIKKNYDKMERAIAGEELERKMDMERRRTEPRIDYSKIYRKEPEQEGLGDISALLDELF